MSEHEPDPEPGYDLIRHPPEYKGEVAVASAGADSGGAAAGERLVGRRVFAGLLGLGVLGTITGGSIAAAMRNTVGTLGTERFRIYTVTGDLPAMTRSKYELSVDGLVAEPLRLGYADLENMGLVTEKSDFHCVTGWSVHDVDWTGVKMTTLLDAAGADPDAEWVNFHSFDGVYVESLSMRQARLAENMVATGLNGAPLPQSQGYPARSLIPSMYGYKGTKWLNRIEVTNDYTPGYWVERGYAQDGWVGSSNGFGA